MAVDERWVVRTLDKDHCVATWDRVLIQVWRYEATAKAIADLARVARSFIAEARVSVSSIAVVERTSPPPSDVVRTDLSNFYREFAPKMNTAIVVAEGSGFRAAIVRGVGITLSTLAPGKLPFKFVGSVIQATGLIAPYLSAQAGGADNLQRAIDGVRVEIDRSAMSGSA